MRVGILTIAEKWEKLLHSPVQFYAEHYLQEKYVLHPGEKNMFINGAVCPTAELVKEIKKLKDGVTLVQGDLVIAYKKEPSSQRQSFDKDLTVIRYVWDIFGYNGDQIRKDFELVKSRKSSDKVRDKHTVVYNKKQVYVEKGAKMYGAILNAEHGPIYIGKNAEVGEGAMIRGPFALCEGAAITMGGKMRGDTTIGPYCKAGGEVSNSVMFGYSNKAHDGFLGNSVLGEWCNLGAGTTTSNLKNSYGTTQMYSYAKRQMVNTGRQFLGLIMGDHSKAGINTTFNTATMVGVSANIFGADFPDKFIPSFTWGGAGGFEKYQLEKAMEVASRVMGRRNMMFDEVEQRIFRHIYEETEQ